MSVYNFCVRQLPYCVCHSAAVAVHTSPSYARCQSWQSRRPLVQSQKGRDNIGIIEEEDDIYVVEETFRQAYRNSQADTICVPGLQEFAGSVWARRRNNSSGQDPLDHIFSEFDQDGDGYLDATDLTAALSSRNVNITPEQAQMFLEVSDVDSDHKVGRHEFDDFIFHMAAADLAHSSQPQQEGNDVQPELEAEEYDSQKTLSDLFAEGDLAAGLQAWLKLTDNSITGIEDSVCIADEDDNTSL